MHREEIDEITRQIIKAYYDVYKTLGYGFLEKVYENALILELKKIGLTGKRQVRLNVSYQGKIVGKYFADIIVEESVIVELKACESLHEDHEAQLLNYLRATDIEYGLLLNFGRVPELKRKIWTKEYSGKSGRSW